MGHTIHLKCMELREPRSDSGTVVLSNYNLHKCYIGMLCKLI